MASIDVLRTRFFSYDKMYRHLLRVKSFADWPFKEECSCTPEKMASAGFVHCPSDNEPDVACCFFCLIELEGWEPDDNPWTEHKKRSPNCEFIKTKKDFAELTAAEYCHMEKQRMKIYIRKVCNKKMAELQEEIDRTLQSLNSQLDSLRLKF
ncbi:hypothetical protein INR49_009227 [Caranx melampygus]|nr:hypothetical protein INR49_009227 [Caranx melampygus]